MNIIVCLKQVPDTETQIKIADDGQSIVTDDIKWVMNPYDEFGVEEALRLKEKHGGEVTVVGLGPKRVTESIRTALAMGADKGILITDDALEGSDSLATAKALAAAVKDLEYDLIFTGQRGVDDDQGVVGAALAELLGIPQLSLIVKMEVADDASSVKAERPIEGGNPGDRIEPAGADHGSKGFERTAIRIASRHHESQEETPGRKKPWGSGPGCRTIRKRCQKIEDYRTDAAART